MAYERYVTEFTDNENRTYGVQDAEAREEVSELKSAITSLVNAETEKSKNLNRTPYVTPTTQKGVTISRNSDGSIALSGTPTGNIYWPSSVVEDKWLLPAGTYTLSGGFAEMAVTINLYANKSDTSSSMQKSSGTTATTFTTEQDYWAWVRFDILSTATTDGVTLYPQVEVGSVATEYQSPDYVAYKIDKLDGIESELSSLSDEMDSVSDDVSELDTEVGELNERIGAVAAEKVGKNKVNPSSLVTGYIQSNGSVATNDSYALYSTSEFIPLDANTDYVFSCYNSSGNLRTSISVAALMFDESKVPITESYQNVSTGGYLTFNSGATGKFVRVTTRTASSLFQLESGRTTPSGFEEYEAHEEIELRLGNIPVAQVEEKIAEGINNSGVIQYETGKNLVDPAKLVTGFIYKNGNVDTSGANANYSTSDFISLNANTDYAFTCFNESTHAVRDLRVVCLLFDETRTPITESYQNVSGGGFLTFNSGETAKFVRVSTITNNSIFQVEQGSASTSCEEYRGKYVSGYPLGDVPFAQTQTDNILFRKKWAVCGDSFTDGATDGVITEEGIYKGSRFVYPYIIGNRNEMEIVKFFNGGQTLAFPAQPGTFANSLTNPNNARFYQNIPADADYITIYLGINDANHASESSQDGEDTTGYIPLGEITDSTTASYYGAWNVVLTWLISNRPYAHIGIIVTNGNSDDNYRQAQIAVAKKFGLPYVDLNGDERTPSMHRTSNPNISATIKTALLEKWRVSSSNTHPNDAAHLFESTIIENFLRGI